MLITKQYYDFVQSIQIKTTQIFRPTKKSMSRETSRETSRTIVPFLTVDFEQVIKTLFNPKFSPL